MYKIAILDEDKAYLERLIFFLKEHHGEHFEIYAVNSLDDLGQEVEQYRALFFSDEVAVDAALFPVNIAIGYLTEKSEMDEQYINKYQSMEQIYRRMIRLCERKKDVVRPQEDAVQIAAQDCVLRAETVTTDGETYRIYHVDEKKVDRFAVRMLAGNRIKGLFQIECQSGGIQICITGMKSLYEYVKTNNSYRGKKQLFQFFAEMIATAQSLEEYMLSPDQLMFNPTEIYINQAGDGVLIPYLPIQSERPWDSRQYLEKIKDLCSALIDGIDEEKEYLSQELGKLDTVKKPKNIKKLNAIKKPETIEQSENRKESETIEQIDIIKRPETIKQSDIIKNDAETIKQSDVIKNDAETIKQSENRKRPTRVNESRTRSENIELSDNVDKSDNVRRPNNKKKLESAEPSEKIRQSRQTDNTDQLDSTMESESQQKKVTEDQQHQESTKVFKKSVLPYIIRKRTGERIVINHNLFKLGKDASYVDYCIQDNPAVSRNHADIVRKSDGFYLVDRGSLNHTFVNGKKLEKGEYRKLEDGCLMQLADEVFEIKLK